MTSAKKISPSFICKNLFSLSITFVSFSFEEWGLPKGCRLLLWVFLGSESHFWYHRVVRCRKSWKSSMCSSIFFASVTTNQGNGNHRRPRSHFSFHIFSLISSFEVIPQRQPVGDHMANGRVEMAVREVQRQCRTLQISVEQNTGVRIADDSPLLSWLPRFAAHVMNKMRIGKDGKTREMRRTGRRWRKPMT